MDEVKLSLLNKLYDEQKQNKNEMTKEELAQLEEDDKNNDMQVFEEIDRIEKGLIDKID